jgi:hypothetical protein
VSITFRPNGCKQVTFMLEHAGGHHALKIKIDPGTILCVPFESVSGGKPKQDYARQSTSLPPLKDGAWTTLTLDMRGPKAEIRMGDSTTTVEHPDLAALKESFSIDFAYGRLEVKEVVLSAADARAK